MLSSPTYTSKFDKQNPAPHQCQWVQTFEKVVKTETATSIAMFAYKVTGYLKPGKGCELYNEAYELKIDNKSLKRRIEAVNANTCKMMKLNETKKPNEEVHQKHTLVVSTSSYASSSAHVGAFVADPSLSRSFANIDNVGSASDSCSKRCDITASDSCSGHNDYTANNIISFESSHKMAATATETSTPFSDRSAT